MYLTLIVIFIYEYNKIVNHFLKNNFKYSLINIKYLNIIGLLERPSLPPSAPQVCYKLFMYGKAGAGKTYVMNKLMGLEVKLLNIVFVSFFKYKLKL